MRRGIFRIKENLRIRAGWCKTSVRRAYLKLTYQYLWDLDCRVFARFGPAGKNASGEPKCNQLLRFSLSVTTPATGKKKTCASAQAGVSKVVNLTLTPPINTSGIARISTCSADKPANIRNSASQSVSKGLYFPEPVSITDSVNVNRSPISPR